jgi:DNA segregation ATPase FtsK/SpoIIIE, S-DNA-T family
MLLSLTPPFIMPESMKKRTSQCFGISLLFLSVFLVLALLSYNSGDPSLNRAAGGVIKNLMGVSGAIISDLCLQLFGLGTVVVIAMCMAWGWRLIKDYSVNYVWLRMCALILSLVAFCTALAFIPSPMAWPYGSGLGGSIGLMVAGAFGHILPSLLIIPLALVTVIASALYGLGLRRAEWQMIGLWCVSLWKWMRGSIRYVINLFSSDATPLVQGIQSSTSVEQKSVVRKVQSDVKATVSQVRQKTVLKTEPASKQTYMELRHKQGDYELPSFTLLTAAPKVKGAVVNESALTQNATMLESVLHDFGVKGEIINIHPGPVVTLYELEPAAGTKSSRVIGLADDIARSMSAISARISVIPGRNALGIELPNVNRQTVYLREMLEHEEFRSSKMGLPLALGKNIAGEPVMVDLSKMPHLLVAGTTGAGKSVAINTMITSLLYHHTPDTCKFIMIDPKMLELSVYDNIPHLLTPVVTEPGKAVVALKWTVKEMENRYRLMASLGVRNVSGFNQRLKEAKRTGEVLTREVQTGFDPDTGRPVHEKQKLDLTPLPFIVVVVDEMADLMLVAGKDIEGSIQRLAQMARAAGIHIIMATQRPSVDVITGVIKANFPTRISFQVTSKIDSRTILGEMGAEQLLGQGDMLYMAGGGRITRVHGPFVSDSEVEDVVEHLKRQGPPQYVADVTVDDEESLDEFDEDESEEDKLIYDRAVAIVARDRKASTSYVQRCLKIGYNRAARVMEKMERDGIVSAANHVGKREVLVPEGR